MMWLMKGNTGKEAKDAAWYYAEPKTEKANNIKDHIAFCKGFKLQENIKSLQTTRQDES